MNQSSTLEPAIEPVKSAGPHSGSRFYACVITGATVLLLGMLLWPLTVHTFRSTASFEIGYEASSGLDKSALNQLVISAMRDATRPEITMNMIKRIKSTIKSPLLVAQVPRNSVTSFRSREDQEETQTRLNIKFIFRAPVVMTRSNS